MESQALHLHPIIVLLVVIGGGQLAGLAGVIFAVVALAVLRVFFDFFRARIRTRPDGGIKSAGKAWAFRVAARVVVFAHVGASHT